jgi:proline dehydrogenase
MINFDNTEIAFAGKSNKDLKRAYWLFKMIGNSSLVTVGKGLTNFVFALHLPVKGMIKATIFKQFCGGETIADSKEKIEQLAVHNVKTILDYSIEGKESVEDFETTVREIIATIETGANDPSIPFAVFKITGISRFSILEKANDSSLELTENDKAEITETIDRIDRICRAAYEHQQPLFIDAEESWIQDFIDRTVRLMMAKYNNERAIVYNTVQIYRHDRLSFLNKEIEQAKQAGFKLGIKLVRGAYMEKERERAQEKGYPSPIQPNKASCDQDFDMALKLMMDNIDHMAICAGTHNENSSLLLANLIEERGIEKSDDRIYFAQLLGMSDHISFNLAHHGYNVAKYVPYGPVREVMPYLIRRADENTSVAGQTGRELSLIIKERKRRKA